MKCLMSSLILTALFVAACNTSAAPEATSEIDETVAEEAAPAAATETAVPATEAPLSHAFETGSSSLAIEVPLDGRLAEPVEIETEKGVRFSAEAGTLLRTLSGMFVTGPITIGIDDDGDFGALPDDIAVDGIVRVYVLVQTASGPELLNVRFEPAGQLRISLTEEHAGEWATYSPAARGGGRLQGALPETTAAATSGVLAAPANSDVRLQESRIIIPGKVVTGFNRYLGQPVVDFGEFGNSRIVGLAGFTDTTYVIEDPITIKVEGWGGIDSHYDIIDLLLGIDADAVDGGFDPGSWGSYMSEINIVNFAGSANDVVQALSDADFDVSQKDGNIVITIPCPWIPAVDYFGQNIWLYDLLSLEILWSATLEDPIEHAMISSDGENMFLLTENEIFDEMSFVVAGAPITKVISGAGVNLVTKAGENLANDCGLFLAHKNNPRTRTKLTL